MSKTILIMIFVFLTTVGTVSMAEISKDFDTGSGEKDDGGGIDPPGGDDN